jgi:hypothetical protein
VSDPDDLAWVDARRHPHPARTLTEPVRVRGASAGVPRSYVACADHAGLRAAFGADPLAPFVRRAHDEGWPLVTIDAPHAAHITAPGLVAAALSAAAARMGT